MHLSQNSLCSHSEHTPRFSPAEKTGQINSTGTVAGKLKYICVENARGSKWCGLKLLYSILHNVRIYISRAVCTARRTPFEAL